MYTALQSQSAETTPTVKLGKMALKFLNWPEHIVLTAVVMFLINT